MHKPKYSVEMEYPEGSRPEILSREIDRETSQKLQSVTNPELTIISPCYNTGRFLEDTIRSIANQTFTNFEHIVIDGGSTDETLEILKKYPHVRWISEKDSGYPEAFRKGLKMARGKYVMQCCVSDGFANKNWFKYCVDALNKNPEISLVFGLPQYLSEGGIAATVSPPFFRSNEIPHGDKFLTEWLINYNYIPEGNLCVRKNVSVECYPKEGEGANQTVVDWGLFAYNFFKFGFVPAFLPVAANFGRTHDNQMGEEWGKKGLLKRMNDNYKTLIRIFRRQLVLGSVKYIFIDCQHKELDISFSKKDFIRELILSKIMNIFCKIRKIPAKLRKLMKKIVKTTAAFSIVYYLFVLRSKIIYFISDLNNFKKKSTDRFSLKTEDWMPILDEKTAETDFSTHYIYHPAWAARILAKTKPAVHIDISSILYFSTIMSAFVETRFYDYRPANIKLSNFSSEKANLTALPFSDASVRSLSCMHTVEHIGLGRYGEQIEPDGDLKAISELKRVLSPGGDLLFVVPVGRPRLCFNAHRVYSYNQIINYFADLTLVEFALITERPEDGGLIYSPDIKQIDKLAYGCGCFWFKKN